MNISKEKVSLLYNYTIVLIYLDFSRISTVSLICLGFLNLAI